MFCTSADPEMYGKPVLCSLSIHRLLSTPKYVCVCVCVCVLGERFSYQTIL